LVARALGGIGLDLADRLLKCEALARDVGFVERRFDAAPLVDQRGARALVEHAAVLAGVLVEPGDGAGDQRVVVSHCASTAYFPHHHTSNGFCTELVSSRSGLVESMATGQPTNSSIRRTYFIACAGN